MPIRCDNRGSDDCLVRNVRDVGKRGERIVRPLRCCRRYYYYCCCWSWSHCSILNCWSLASFEGADGSAWLLVPWPRVVIVHCGSSFRFCGCCLSLFRVRRGGRDEAVSRKEGEETGGEAGSTGWTMARRGSRSNGIGCPWCKEAYSIPFVLLVSSSFVSVTDHAK